ncbi:MAG: hypothetical protein WC975_02480 [Phycisphaerae bacterium]
MACPYLNITHFSGKANFGREYFLPLRRQRIKDTDQKGLIATPANSFINELVVEAARMSILKDGQPVKILYGNHPHAELRS